MSDTDLAPIVLERTFATTQDKLWRALTTPHLLAEWLMPNTLSQAAVGASFQFVKPATAWWNGVTDSRILAMRPQRHLALTFEPTGQDALTAPKVEVRFDLTPLPQGVHLRFELVGFRQGQDQLIRGATGAWGGMLARLQALTEGAMA